MRTARDGALALAAELRHQDATAATALRDEIAGGDELAQPGPAQIAAAGPRAEGHEAEYELLIEMIHEGSRLHYGAPRVIRDDDRDLALLLGDQLYAMGLSRLAEVGDLEAVAELADLISLLAQVQAESANDDLVEAIWRAGCTAVGCGSTPEHEAAKALARAGDERALEALRQAGERPVS
jgi:hypothetical protein